MDEDVHVYKTSFLSLLLTHIKNSLLQAGYSVVAACVMTLRLDDTVDTQIATTSMSKRTEGITCITVIACCGFAAGILYRYGVSTLAYTFLVLPIAIAILAAAGLQFRQASGIKTASEFYNLFISAISI